MENNFSQETIEAYLNKTLKGSTLTEFEKALHTDVALQKRVELSKDLEQAFQQKTLESEITPTLQPLGEKYILNTTIPSSTTADTTANTNKRWWLLGILLIVIITGIWIWTQQNTSTATTSDKIFATHFTPYSTDEITRGTTDIIREDYQTAIEHYNNGEYKTAISLFQTELTASPDDVRLQLLLGNSYLSTTQTANAIAILKPLSEDKSHLLTEAAQWYLALAFLQQGEKALALPLLETLSDKKIGQYATLATQLLSEL